MKNKLRVEELIKKAKLYNPSINEDLILKAYEVASKAHEQQIRKDGDPYISHPIAVAEILCDMEMDCESIVAGLLHDVVEDTAISNEDVKTQFGEDIAYLVDGVTKLGKIPYSSKEEQQIENLRKMFLAMAKDVRVIIIKLADRLHNMRTLDIMPERKRRQKALETMEVYSPLAHRLGISKIKDELEDIAIRHLDPIGYKEILGYVSRLYEKNSGFVDIICKRIKERLDEASIESTIQGRTKHIYSIYRKVVVQNRTFDEVYDLYAVRVIVNSVLDCYNVLGVIHDMYQPLPGRFKDYISTPKPNMYQSLHTTVISKKGLLFEVQIRTWDMHRIAEYGIAAHWKYKSGAKGSVDMDAKLAWIRQLLEIQKESTDPEDFMRALKIDLFADEVFVFTPKGDVKNLPIGSTVIDFAYGIHSAVGNRMNGAKVNGRIMPLDTLLQNGDIVEILTSNSIQGPSFDWLKIAKTSEARNKIRQWFKKEKREENIIRGKESLEKELRRNGIKFEQFEKKEILTQLFKKFHVSTLEDLYSGIGYGGISLSNVVMRVSNDLRKMADNVEIKNIEDIQTKIEAQNNKRIQTSDSGIIIEGVDNVLTKFARCCNPLPGDDVIGFVTKGYGVSVHKRDCINVINNLDKSDRWLPVRWAHTEKKTFSTVLNILSRDCDQLIANVVNLITNMHISMHSFNARETKDGYVNMTVTLQIKDVEQLSSVINKLSKVEGVMDVSRSTQ